MEAPSPPFLRCPLRLNSGATLSGPPYTTTSTFPAPSLSPGAFAHHRCLTRLSSFSSSTSTAPSDWTSPPSPTPTIFPSLSYPPSSAAPASAARPNTRTQTAFAPNSSLKATSFRTPTPMSTSDPRLPWNEASHHGQPYPHPARSSPSSTSVQARLHLHRERLRVMSTTSTGVFAALSTTARTTPLRLSPSITATPSAPASGLRPSAFPSIRPRHPLRPQPG